MGAEAIKELLKRVDVEKLAVELREMMRTENSAQKKAELAKRLKVVDAFRKSGNKPEWMILDVIPVIRRSCARWCRSTAAASRRRT